MATDDLKLVIGTLGKQYTPGTTSEEILADTAKEMSNAIDQMIVEELNQYKTKWDQQRIIDISQQKEYKLNYKELEKYMDEPTKYYLKRNMKE